MLPDDTVSYDLYPLLSKEDDEKLDPLFYLQQINHLLLQYPWHREGFNLKYEPSRECLHGETNFGENVEDEWFIVFILRKLTYDNAGLIVRVTDSDGDFLLIEAAEKIPKWIDPENSMNRVFIYEGKLHIIPVGTNPSQHSRVPTIKLEAAEAIDVLRRYPSKTECSPEVQDSCFNRVSLYPEKISTLQHLTQVTLPPEYASLVTQHPSVLPIAVSSYCERDPGDLKLINVHNKCNVSEMITVNVYLTKVMYAQLRHAPLVTVKLKKMLPPLGDPKYLSVELGLKLSSGLDIALSRKKQSTLSNTGQQGDVLGSKEGKKYLDSLKKNGYFKGELEGSVLYKKLLVKAKDYYLNSGVADGFNSCEGEDKYSRLSRLFNSVTVDLPQLKLAQEHLLPPDDESWINITEAELDEHLAKTYGVERGPAQDLPETLAKFLGEVSDLEGVENLMSGVKSSKKAPLPSDPISFNAGKFGEVLNGILDLTIPEDTFDSDDDSDFDYSDDNEIEGDKDKIMAEYFKQMDLELQGTTMGESFVRNQVKDKTHASNDEFDDVEDFVPVDIDKNALANILESYSSQMGLSGPASTLLSSLGVKFTEADTQAKQSS